MSERAVSSPRPGPPRMVSPRLRRRVRPANQSGAAVLEFALVIPVFIFVLYGLITFGVILAQKQQITAAASDGARAAVGQTTFAAAQAAATTRVQQSLGSPVNYSASYTQSTCGTGNCITVDIVYNYAAHPLVPPAPGIGLFIPSTFHSTAVVQYS